MVQLDLFKEKWWYSSVPTWSKDYPWADQTYPGLKNNLIKYN